jgi:hypothetical protein
MYKLYNRKTNGRQWLNMNILINFLNKKNIKWKIINLEEHTLAEQMTMIYNSKYILFPQGSSLGHLYWVDPNTTTCIECIIPGQRYVNSLIYSKNLSINLITLFNKYDFDKSILNNISNDLRDVLNYQKNASLLLESNKINSDIIIKENECFEKILNCPRFYCRMYVENIDMKLYFNRIVDIINNNNL